MFAVWKYELKVDDGPQIINMPAFAQVLTVQEQHGRLMLWAKVNTTVKLDQRVFHVVGTGHPHDWMAEADYIGTLQAMNGTLIWHVFEKWSRATPAHV